MKDAFDVHCSRIVEVLRWLHRHHCCSMFCVRKVYNGVYARLAGLGFYFIHGTLRFTACIPWRVRPDADFDGCLRTPADAVALASSMWLLLLLEIRDSSLFRHAAHLPSGYIPNGATHQLNKFTGCSSITANHPGGSPVGNHIS